MGLHSDSNSTGNSNSGTNGSGSGGVSSGGDIEIASCGELIAQLGNFIWSCLKKLIRAIVFVLASILNGLLRLLGQPTVEVYPINTPRSSH